jgi:hypothetical protein
MHHQDPHPSGCAGPQPHMGSTPRWDPCLLGMPDPPTTMIPAPWQGSCQTTAAGQINNPLERKREWKPFHWKNKVVQDLEQNEENGYPDPDANKTKINYTKEPNESHKKILKDEILQVINKNFIKMLLDMVNQNVK